MIVGLLCEEDVVLGLRSQAPCTNVAGETNPGLGRLINVAHPAGVSNQEVDDTLWGFQHCCGHIGQCSKPLEVSTTSQMGKPKNGVTQCSMAPQALFHPHVVQGGFVILGLRWEYDSRSDLCWECDSGIALEIRL